MTLQEPDAILAKLQGQTIVLPDLEPMFDGWPRGVNQNLEQLRRDVDGWLGSAMKHSTRLGSLKAADIGYWGATWWPQAKYERLRIGTFLVAWLFVWDDELDMKDGSLWHSFELSNSYRNETREYVQYCLGLTDENHHFIAGAINATVRAFETIGEAICKAYDHDQRKRLMVDMEQFIEMTRTEQMLRLRGTLPSLEEFWSYRLGSSAVPVIIAMNEFAWGTNGLPAILLKDGDVKLLCDYTNIIISTLNDILSLKKEIACGSIGSMIPLLYAQSSDAQMAVDQTAQYLFANVKAFRDTVQRLLGSDRKDGLEGPPELYNLIEGCQIYCTGNLTWRNVPVQYEPFVTLLTLGVQSCYPTIWNVRPGHDWWSACYTLSVGQGLVGLCPI